MPAYCPTWVILCGDPNDKHFNWQDTEFKTTECRLVPGKLAEGFTDTSHDFSYVQRFFKFKICPINVIFFLNWGNSIILA